MINAVLFDLDGVLFDSESWHQEMSVRCLEDLGAYDFDPKLMYYAIGTGKGVDPWDRIYEEAPAKYREMNFKEIFGAYKKAHYEWVPYAEVIFPEVPNCLEALKKSGYKLACCSSGRREYIDSALKSSDLEQYFDLIVSGFDFKRSKPDPEIYLTSAAKLNSAVEECLVVEDSPYGIKAGKNAGMLVAARNDHVFGFDQSEADFHFDTLEELPKILETINS